MTSNAVIDISGTTSITTGPECCSADCPIAIKSCAADAVTGVTCSGHGVCLSGSGVCHCFDGYVGDRCDACDVSYATRQSSTGHVSACVFLPGATLSPAAGNSSSTITTNGDGSTGTVPIKFALEVVGGLVTVAVVCGAVLLTLLRRRRARLGRIEHWPRHDGTTSRCASSGILPVGQVSAVPCRPSGGTRPVNRPGRGPGKAGQLDVSTVLSHPPGEMAPANRQQQRTPGAMGSGAIRVPSVNLAGSSASGSERPTAGAKLARDKMNDCSPRQPRTRVHPASVRELLSSRSRVLPSGGDSPSRMGSPAARLVNVLPASNAQSQVWLRERVFWNA